MERHQTGAEEYGPFKFLENDTLGMLEEELADIANYARYTFIKVRMMRLALAGEATKLGSEDGSVKLSALDSTVGLGSLDREQDDMYSGLDTQ